MKGFPEEDTFSRERGSAQYPAQEEATLPTASPPSIAEQPTEKMQKLTVQPKGRSKDVTRLQRVHFDEFEQKQQKLLQNTLLTVKIYLPFNSFILKSATNKLSTNIKLTVILKLIIDD